jgi:amino-acid N-acetyltransferase
MKPVDATHRASVTLRALVAADMPAVRALLAASELPTEDIDDASISLVGAFDGDVLVGVIGLQACGGVGLLRSLAVAPSHRDRGIARALCQRVFAMTGERAMTSLWLLTTSAKDYFTRLGFDAVARDEAPEAIRSNAQFTALCPSSAQVMRRR